MKKKFSESLIAHKIVTNAMTCEYLMELIAKISGPITIEVSGISLEEERALVFSVDGNTVVVPAHFLIHTGMTRDEIILRNTEIEKEIIGDVFRKKLISFIEEIPQNVDVSVATEMDICTIEHMIKNLDGRKREKVYLDSSRERYSDCYYRACQFSGRFIGIEFVIDEELWELCVIRCGSFPPFSQKDLSDALSQIVLEKKKEEKENDVKE